MTKQECAALAGAAADKSERDMRAAFVRMHGEGTEPDRWMVDAARYFGSNSVWALIDYDKDHVALLLDLTE